MTDLHIQPERHAAEGVAQAIDTAMTFSPDFILTGGDLIYDALEKGYGRADSLYRLYEETTQRSRVPIHNTMGNHEIFGLYASSGVDTAHPEYGKRMYEKRIGPRCHSFHHKGWHFIILDSVSETEERNYVGRVDSAQIAWLKNDLDSLNPDVPIVVATHIPFITSMTQLRMGSLEPNSEHAVIRNSKEVLELFAERNLKLVLQGHLHFLEDLFVMDKTHFLTGGAVSARWWRGPRDGLEEGFVVIHVRGNEFSWEYVDYGWEAQE